jgi:hypothetical protein
MCSNCGQHNDLIVPFGSRVHGRCQYRMGDVPHVRILPVNVTLVPLLAGTTLRSVRGFVKWHVMEACRSATIASVWSRNSLHSECTLGYAARRARLARSVLRAMIRHIHSYLVYPAKGEDAQPEISGTDVPLDGKLFDMLKRLYDEAETDCNIPIVFRATEEGKQENPRRTQILTYLRRSTLVRGQELAQELQSVTTNRSGLGLFFLIAGQESKQHHRIVLSRFPADEGIVANESRTTLKVEFIERIFMKSARAYKSATFKGASLDSGFWKGRAVDKQISGTVELSQYWIDEFLLAQIETTAAAGTKRLAQAVRKAIKETPDPEVKTKLVAASGLLGNLGGQHVSPESIVQSFSLPPAAAEAIRTALPRPESYVETFQFDSVEYERELPFRAVELDNGAHLFADNKRFDEVFHSEPLDGETGKVRYTTEGKVVRQNLAKRP